MDIEFWHDGELGLVSVSCVPNKDPSAFGKGEDARGLPVCTATIEHPGRGYRAFFGWVQLVRSTDNAFGGQAFEVDPTPPLEDSPTPYCWYGLKPVLFDAPSRDRGLRLEWLAHSFLGFTPLDDEARKVAPLLGFSWGFVISDGGGVTLMPVRRLMAGDWDAHLPYLRRGYPEWEFAAAVTFGPG
jgi:hypothetical protein